MLKLQQAIDLQQARQATTINFLLGQMEATVGLPGLFPRYEVPTPTIATGAMTFNNIRVDNSNIGVINTGQMHKLDLALTQVREAGDAPSAEVLRLLTQAVLDAADVGSENKAEMVDHLAFLATQATLPKQDRQSTIGKTSLRALERLLNAAASLTSLWPLAKPVLEALF